MVRLGVGGREMMGHEGFVPSEMVAGDPDEERGFGLWCRDFETYHPQLPCGLQFGTLLRPSLNLRSFYLDFRVSSTVRMFSDKLVANRGCFVRIIDASKQYLRLRAVVASGTYILGTTEIPAALWGQKTRFRDHKVSHRFTVQQASRMIRLI